MRTNQWIICAVALAGGALVAGGAALAQGRTTSGAYPQYNYGPYGAYRPESVGRPMTSGTGSCSGANLFPCGPLYNGNDYLGNDPDPFIRSMIQRDLGAKYGGPE
jgi:hypothetical protein